MPQLLCATFDDLANLLRDDCWRRRLLERRLEHVAEAADLRVRGVCVRLLDSPGHGSVDDPWLNDCDADIEGLYLLGERFTERFERKFRSGVRRQGEQAIRPATDVTLMMHPLCLFRMSGSQARIERSAPK